jgi:L-ascorbate metabolism protein UlaG (beta-lactamase superfamily)
MAITVTWLGHACWLIDTGSHKLLVDPFLDDCPTAACKAADVEAEFVLVTHGHGDHVADAAAICQRTGATLVANYEICEWLAGRGVKQTEPMNLGGQIALPFGRVKMTIAHHSSTMPDGAPGGNPGGFVLALPAANIYIAGDTALFDEMERIGQATYAGRQGIDLAIVPIGDRYTMGPDEALEAVALVAPTHAAPSHYNTWPPIAQDANSWAEKVRQTGVVAHAPAPGGSIRL